jgi:general L-amino acid transport system permease protein
MSKKVSTVSTPFWRDNRIIPILLQLLFVVVIGLVIMYLTTNALQGLARIGMEPGFEFLNGIASFDIGEKLIEYSSTSSYWTAVLVGILNTLKVSIIGIILATILGVLIGVTRLSNNWLARSFASLYIEVLRNTPLLVQLFIWYFAVFLALPRAQESIELPGSIYLNNKGISMPWFHANSVTTIWVSLFIVGIIASIVFWKVKIKAQVETGKRKYPSLWAIGSFVVAILLALVVTQQAPVNMTYPELGRFSFEGGYTLSTNFAAILFGLVLYTSTYIAEIVRAGVLAVSKGQVEAANALGLKRSTTMRLVIFPQAFRIIIPPITSQYLNLVKNSSLAVAVGYPDIVFVGQTILNQTGRALEMITVMILVYLCISLFTSFIMNVFNKRTQLVER